ncbi:hypothetical protein OG599_30905 [Streptomyces sp. NBC_01335]|uniref:hypothetical protein n=1 Tax=Streptomyces sp. NBC_01335 TaxID=2903828 RepID=UPI002E0E2C61|nr:hypothetical protein OG599_30905 [Streptomyces sp. NBC_01335]
MTEQSNQVLVLMRKYTLNSPTVRRVPLSSLSTHGRRLVFGVTGYRWPDSFALEFVDGGLVARNYRFDLKNVGTQIAQAGVSTVSMVTRANGTWGSDGAYLLEGSPPIHWVTEPGLELLPHQVCVELTPDLCTIVRAQEHEHLQDFALAWVLTVGLFVERLPTSGYGCAGDALEALAEQFTRADMRHLVPSGSLTDLQVWVQHLKTRAMQLADQSGLRDSNGSHSPLSCNARIDYDNDERRIILTPVMRPVGPPLPVINVRSLPD